MQIMLSDHERVRVNTDFKGVVIRLEECKAWGPEPSRKQRIELAKLSACKGYVPKGGWGRWKPEPWPTGTYWSSKQSIEMSDEAARHLGQMLLERARLKPTTT